MLKYMKFGSLGFENYPCAIVFSPRLHHSSLILHSRVLSSFLFSLLSVAFIPFQSEVERGYLLSSDIIPEHHFLANSGNRPHCHTVITVQFQYLKSNSRLSFALSPPFPIYSHRLLSPYSLYYNIFYKLLFASFFHYSRHSYPSLSIPYYLFSFQRLFLPTHPFSNSSLLSQSFHIFLHINLSELNIYSSVISFHRSFIQL